MTKARQSQFWCPCSASRAYELVPAVGRPWGQHGSDQPKSQRAGPALGEDIGEALPRAHRVISNLKTWLRGTYRTVSELQVYLDQFVFRFNRRRTPMSAFQTLLGIGARLPPTTYQEIKDGAFVLAEQTG